MGKEEFMKEALIEAKKAYTMKETPIGAVVVYDGKVVGRGFNIVEHMQDSTGHAEIMAIKDAQRKLSKWRLFDCQLYVTMEPCFMCAGAIANSRIKEVFIGARHSKNHVVDKHNGYKLDYYEDNKISYEFGILEEECSKILSEFFIERRKSKA